MLGAEKPLLFSKLYRRIRYKPNRPYSHKLLTINNYVIARQILHLPIRFIYFTRQFLRKSLCEYGPWGVVANAQITIAPTMRTIFSSLLRCASVRSPVYTHFILAKVQPVRAKLIELREMYKYVHLSSSPPPPPPPPSWCRGLKQSQQLAEQEAHPAPHKDYSLKQGQKIKINLGVCTNTRARNGNKSA